MGTKNGNDVIVTIFLAQEGLGIELDSAVSPVRSPPQLSAELILALL